MGARRDLAARGRSPDHLRLDVRADRLRQLSRGACSRRSRWRRCSARPTPGAGGSARSRSRGPARRGSPARRSSARSASRCTPGSRRSRSRSAPGSTACSPAARADEPGAMPPGGRLIAPVRRARRARSRQGPAVVHRAPDLAAGRQRCHPVSGTVAPGVGADPAVGARSSARSIALGFALAISAWRDGERAARSPGTAGSPRAARSPRSARPWCSRRSGPRSGSPCSATNLSSKAMFETYQRAAPGRATRWS